jgi:hypothetical protein
MRDIVNRTFELEIDRGGLAAEGVRFRSCTFDNCALSLVSDPARMSRVARCELIDCYSLNSTIGPCHITDVRIENLKTGDLMLVWGPVLTRLELKGKIGRVKINDAIQDPHASEAQQKSFRILRQEHYAEVDWALDISGARPLMLDISGIPASKVRRDPEMQIVVSNTRLKSLEQLKALPGLDADTEFVLQQFVRNEETDKILAAPTGRGPKFVRPVLNSFALLRQAGIAE